MPEDVLRESIVDEEHLKLLSLGYMISAGFAAFFSLFGLMYAFMGIMLRTIISHQGTTAPKPGQAPPAFVGGLLAGIGLALFLAMIALAAAKLRTAFCLKHRKCRTFCMIVAGISCLELPYGTALGVLSFIVLGRDSVIQLFDRSVSPEV